MDPRNTFTDEEITGFAPPQQSPAAAVPMGYWEAKRANEIAYRAPWLAPQTVVALAKGQADDPTVDLAAQYSAQRELDNYDTKVQNVGAVKGGIRMAFDAVGWAAKTTSSIFRNTVPKAATGIIKLTEPFQRVGAGFVMEDIVKPSIRWSTAALDIIPETVQNIASMAAGTSNYDLLGLWESTSLATMLDDPDRQGEGFFMSQVLREEQAKRARAFRGTVYGNAFTIGRSMTQMFGEKSIAYRYGSGIIDAITMMAVPDPTKFIAKGIAFAGKSASATAKAIRSGEEIISAIKNGGGVRALVPLLSAEDAESVRKGLKGVSDALKSEAGLAKGIEGVSVDGNKFVNFMRTNSWAKRLVSDLVEEDDPYKILSESFGYKVSTDTAIRLANAKNEDEVISALTRPFTLGEGTLEAQIGKYKVTRNPAKQMVKNMRFFATMPKDSIVVTGLDDFDNVDAIKNLTNSMRAAGVKSDVINEWGRKYINGFTSVGTRTARFRAIEAYQSAVKEVMRTSGVADEAADEIIKNANTRIDIVKNYLSNRLGIETDNGMIRQIMDNLSKSADSKLYAEILDQGAEFGDDLVFATPTDLVQLLNRVYVLPDTRELRRVTRNPLFTDMLKKIGLEEQVAEGKIKKLPLAGRTEMRKVVKYTDPEEARNIRGQISDLRDRARGAKGQVKKDIQAEIDDLSNRLNDISYEDTVRTMTGRARRPIELADFIQSRIWKPLNLATVGYIVRNAIDAQTRMAMGGPASMYNLNPFEYISVAIGLPGQNMKYAKSITGVDLRQLGIATQTRAGVIKPIIEGEEADVLKVADRVFPNTATGRKRAANHSKRTGRPIRYPINDGVTLDDVTSATEVHRQLADSIGGSRQRVGMSQSEQVRHKFNTGSWVNYDKSQRENYTRGMIQHLQQKQQLEPQRILARAIAAGKSPEESVNEVVDWFLKNRNSDSYRNLAQKAFDGFEFKRRNTPYSDVNLSINFNDLLRRGLEDEVRGHIKAYVTSVWYDDMKKLTGNIPEMEFLLAYDAVPDFSKSITMFTDDIPLTRGRKAWKVGDKVDTDQGRGVITNIDMRGDRPLATIVPMIEENALKSMDPGTASKNVKRLIQDFSKTTYDATLERGLPDVISMEQRITPGKGLGDWTDTLTSPVRVMTDWLFNSLNDRSVRVLERSPTFRGFYYETISQYANRLSAEEGKRLYDDIFAKASEQGMSIRQYLGETRIAGGNVYSIIENLPKRTNVTGTLTIQELDDFARFEGINRTKDLLYDASERSNLIDALRIVMPFADAWKEVLGTYMTLGAQHNVHLMRKFTRVYTGLEEADPDQDGRGIFFRDPQTNEVQFQFPLSGSLTKALTGIDAPLSAPLGRLSQGINFMPALGPYGQFALSKIVPDTPEYNDFKSLFLPYGETTGGELIAGLAPGVVRKAIEAFTADTENTTTQFANTYLETLRALSVNPKYDLGTETGRTSLLADAKYKARIMMMMRAMSQFLGPSSGVQEWKVPTKTGDQYVGVLLEEFRRYQMENYDTAIDRFLNNFGDDLALYVSSKTKAQRDGLEATQEFGDWERTNRDILAEYTTIGTYFAPMGSEFNFSVWERQLSEGSRVRLKDVELINLAQLRIGSVKYRKMRQMFGANPSQKQQEVLRAYRQYLNELMPGFPIKPEFTTNKFENSIAELQRAVDDSRLAKNPITPLVKQYLNARTAAMNATGTSLRAKKADRYKQYLFQLGESLAATNSEFDRIWSRFLSQEVEL